ncbi:MAG TPA: hypothetical protein VKU40_17785 [Thermoanaerobaculia bacterium]|nr:hypothetical protein [Thermoanaerobaculia bacterium]
MSVCRTSRTFASPSTHPLRLPTLALAVLTLLLIPACGGSSDSGGSSGPTAPQCVSLAGQWSARISTSCPDEAMATVTITQSSCTVSFSAPLVGSVSGTLGASSDPQYVEEAPVDITLPADCDGGAETVGEIRVVSGTEVVMPFGTGDDCCRHGLIFFDR